MVYPRLTRKQLKTHYQLIKRSTGITIKESPHIVMPTSNTHNEGKGWAGLYMEQGPHNDPAIFIDMFMSNYQKLATAYHEIGHHICHENNCYCKSRPATNEAHADKFTLQILINNEFYSIALDYMLDLCIRIKEWKGMYHSGAKQLQKFGIWGEVRSILLCELKKHMKTHPSPNQILRNSVATKFLMKF